MGERFRMEDGTIIDTDKASTFWDEDSFYDGSNQISKATGSQWTHERLYKSRKGRYYVMCWSQWQGSHTHVEWFSREAAARWLLVNDEKLPEDLEDLEDQLVE